MSDERDASRPSRAQERGLGRGLSALLGEQDEAPASIDSGDERSGVRALPVELIEANPDQPRRSFGESELDDLAASISDKGVLQPILVRPLPGADRFQIVAGERRWRAAQKARLHEVPCIVREFTDRETLEIAIVENVQRADLNAVEEARAFRQLVEAFGHTQEEIARAIGKSRTHVANTLRLLNFPQAIIDHLERGDITAGHARAAASAPDPEALVGRILAEGLSVRATEAEARKTSGGGKPRPRSSPLPEKDADTRALEADLAERLGLDVEIRHDGEAGELRVRYSSLDQLDDLCRRLNSGSGAY
ncbi:MAG: ParB/RepB/Spo0J family partition protein [Pseudomonadota bacterium]